MTMAAEVTRRQDDIHKGVFPPAPAALDALVTALARAADRSGPAQTSGRHAETAS
jgi:hypothetical protein